MAAIRHDIGASGNLGTPGREKRSRSVLPAIEVRNGARAIVTTSEANTFGIDPAP
jgi:hypothetical protein